MKLNIKLCYLLINTILFSNPSFSQCYSTISSGGAHTVAIKPDGSTWGWGGGNWGQLGNSIDYDNNLPMQLVTDLNCKQVKAGDTNTFIIKQDGTLFGGGGNTYGSLGVGSMSNSFHDFIQIGTSNDWKNIAPSDYFVIAQKTNGTLWGWGQNDDYQMGNGTCCNDQLIPTLISSDTDWKMIASSGSRSSFALKQNGTLWSWGSELSSLTGNVGAVFFPTQRHPDTDWNFISAGKAHVLALKNNGTLWGWGGIGSGVDVPNISDIVQVGSDTWKTISAGYLFSLGIKTDGTLWAWGRNSNGQLGLGTNTDIIFPQQVGTDNDWDKISAGRNHAVAQKTNGSIWVWGDNFYGQLGNGQMSDGSTTPVYLPIDGCVLANESFNKETINLVVTPNPLQNEVTVNYKGNETINTIAIYDILGKIVYKSNPVATKSLTATFPITELQSGTYTLVLKNNDKIVVNKKLVKE